MADQKLPEQSEIVKNRLAAVILIGLCLVLLLFIVVMCAPDNARAAEGPPYQPKCVALAVLCGWTCKYDYNLNTRIALSIAPSGNGHAQVEVQAVIDGDWTPVTPLWGPKGIEVRPWSRHFHPEPYRYLTLEEFISEQGRILRGE